MDFVELDRLRYLGGHPLLPAPVERARVVVGWDGVDVYDRRLRELLVVRPEEIALLTVVDGAALRTRWSASLGHAHSLHALSLDATVLLVVTLLGDLAFELRGVNTDEVWQELRRFESMPGAPSAAQPSPVPPAAESTGPPITATEDPASDRRARLLELRSLHAEALITDAEYEQRRAEIIAEI